MKDAKHTRRRFILVAIAAAGVVAVPTRWLPGRNARAETGPDPDLAHLARLLFPNKNIPNDVYTDIASGLIDAFAAQPSSAQLIDTATAALDAQQDVEWIDAAEDDQITALKNIQGEAFFGAILAGLRGAFYYHPKVWAHLNYPGSSKEHGGYKYRGFDDIDWLPGVN